MYCFLYPPRSPLSDRRHTELSSVQLHSTSRNPVPRKPRSTHTILRLRCAHPSTTERKTRTTASLQVIPAIATTAKEAQRRDIDQQPHPRANRKPFGRLAWLPRSESSFFSTAATTQYKLNIAPPGAKGTDHRCTCTVASIPASLLCGTV